jgi:hypothetical protein
MKGSRLPSLIFTLTLLLVLSVGWVQAQEKGPDEVSQSQDGNVVTALLADAIPVQGRLTDASGVPLSGDHSVTFSLYDDPAAGVLLWSIQRHRDGVHRCRNSRRSTLPGG